jgi:preprotein translocase subunit SecB
MIDLDSDLAGVIELRHMQFNKILFESKSRTVDIKYSADFSVEEEAVSDTERRVTLTCELTGQSGDTRILVKQSAYFGYDGKYWKGFLPNALAIMFPFMRSQIAIVTAQPYMPSVILPTLNIINLLKSQGITLD